MNSKRLLILKDKVCPREHCLAKGQVVAPPAEGALPLLAGSEYALDVISWIGEGRLSGSHSLPEIHRMLVGEREVHISERHVFNLFRVFLALVHCVNADDEGMRKRLQAQGKLSLSLDGVQFDDTSPVLYVIRELISKEVLYSERVFKRDASHIKALLEKVKAIGIPVVGVVSDKEKALVTAVAAVFPGVPHQFCQTHFLKNVAKPMEDEIALVGSTVSDIVTQVRKFERELPKRAESSGSSAAEIAIVQELCKAARTGGKVSGDSLLDPPALKRFERLERVSETTQEALKGKKGGNWRLLSALTTLLSVLTQDEGLVRRLLQQVTIVRRFAHIFKFNTSGQQARRMFRTYLNQLQKSAPDRGRGAPRGHFMRHAIEVANRYWTGLFHCYDHATIPKTNNELEQTFSTVKRRERKATGRKSTVGGPLETCAEFVLEAWATLEVQRDVLKMFREVSRERIQQAMDEIATIAEPARQKRSIQREPEIHLNSLLEAWLKS